MGCSISVAKVLTLKQNRSPAVARSLGHLHCWPVIGGMPSGKWLENLSTADALDKLEASEISLEVQDLEK
ncbi:hypothetical protein M413DRAFT_23582 [Hebeloma cylindrosporum]|uniref:Uncharacterized protein n=1 Tax=Hebeloma cylindrosporum TaxID=76867 RepID=A0A0C3CAA9_HEBCY|nr:hypothetical protein M413DRAFT_23582 [Hebeloma cylindrosporum h7]